jgi:glutamyl-tRNA synthetase
MIQQRPCPALTGHVRSGNHYHTQPLATVRVRFAPSPTGFLHVGGLRTALYNYLFARKHGGVFILRIEDTDRERFVEGAVENLLATLRWAGLTFDEGPERGGESGPYIQSERLALYRRYADILVESDKAYYAFDTPEELEAMREEQKQSGVPLRSYRRALDLSPAEVQEKLDAGTPAVVRMKVPDSTTIAFDDVIRARVEFSSDQLDDQVLMKSDGYPTYHLANVVDDHLMGVTHVIRGEEWLSSTPKHVLLYEAFGWEQPVFAHLPLLLNPDRTKLSKRQGDVAVEDYQRKGYLPEALVNFIAFLGWNPGDERELFSLEELTREFSLDRVGKSGAVFNIEKLNSVNQHYIRQYDAAGLAGLVRPWLEARGMNGGSDAYLADALALLKERVTTLEDFVTTGGFLFADPTGYEPEAVKKYWKTDSAHHLQLVLDVLSGLEDFSGSSTEAVLRSTAERLGVGTGKLIHPVRLALSGRSTGPGLFEMMEVLGKDTCLRRMKRAITTLG